MLSRTLLAFGATLTLALPSSAQLPFPQFFEVDHSQSSGWVSNTGTDVAVIASFIVEEPAVDSLRIHFDRVHLAGSPFDGTGSIVRMTSLKDGHQQTLNAWQMQQWEHGSAWFNGSAVQVDLLAVPGTGDNLVSIDGLEIGTPLGGAYESQCGPTDDRLPSSDPRVARLLPSGCTAWMINDCAKCFLTAGHCGTGNTMVEFNVPFSNANGSWNHPPPSEQYAIDSASKQANNQFGNDWFYFGTVANSQTGMTAFEAQGDAFDLVSPPSVAGNTIRITGHGTDSTPNSTFNQVQQTHVGPFVNNGSILQYQADTTGGNSGSPIIWEEGNAAIGVHTNAGCSTSGGGANQGTPITVAALQAALANPLGICAQGGFGGAFANLGNSKVEFPVTSAPSLSGCGTLQGGTPYDVVLDYDSFSNTTTTAFVILGFTQIDLPFKGGVLVPSPDVVIVVPIDTAVGAETSITFAGIWPPSVPSGSTVYAHAWFDVNAFIDIILASNAISMTTP